jgi:pimeloyl-ACP methyl ester carboxylesterase
MKSKPYWLSIFMLCLAILACNFPVRPAPTIAPPQASPSPILTSAPPTPTSTPSIDYQPLFETGPCRFPVPTGTSPECGDLIVPENRSRLDTAWIRLHVAIFRNRRGQAVADPVVHLAGGPGSSSLEVASYMFNQGLEAVLDQRDLILFDQRGTGYSRPRLDCPERTAVTAQLLEQGLIAPGTDLLILDAFRRCRERLAEQGIDLSAYHSAASAADLNDLRIVLGYEALNLYAVSYGTRLALTMMRDQPQAVRSAVLDSTYPLEVNLYTALSPNAERAFNVFFARCAADPACQASYPDLGNFFYQLVDQLNASPISLTLYTGGAARTVRLDGNLLIDVLFVGLYNPSVTASMPQMIYDISRGEYGILRNRLSLYFDASGALGMQMSVQCAEEIPLDPPEDAYRAAEGLRPQIASFYPASVQPLFAACQVWTGRDPDPREGQAVTSTLPALILAGDHDPITPPAWGQQTHQNLPRSYFREFPGHGHWVTRSSRCAFSMALAFWQDPNTDPGYLC